MRWCFVLVVVAVVVAAYNAGLRCLDSYLTHGLRGIGRDEVPPWFDRRRLLPLLREKWLERKNHGVNRFMAAVRLFGDSESGSTRWAALERKIDRIPVDARPDVVVGIKSGGAFIANRVAARWDPPPPVAYIRASKYGKRTPLQRVLIWMRLLVLPAAVGRRLDNATTVVSERPDPALVAGRFVLLVDDQVGSGSTLRAAKRALFGLGAARVRTFVIACASEQGRRLITYGGKHRYIHRWPWGADA